MALERTIDKARGKWPAALAQLGVDDVTLSGKHCPCPSCGGKDRFRFTDRNQDGVWVCSQCGAGDGLELLMVVKGWTFQTAAREVDKVVGDISPSAPKAVESEAERMARVRKLWDSGLPVVHGDPVHQYLTGRGVPFIGRFSDIRCVSKAFFDGRDMSMMLALMRDPRGHPVTVHRTLIENGRKADVDSPRLMMSGAMPDCSTVIRLGEVRPHIGIAEGIETAAKAAARFKLPVWATATAGFLEKFEPPQGVERVTVFGDNDASFTGQKAAYVLANRLVRKTPKRPALTVDVAIPEAVGTDWDSAK